MIANISDFRSQVLEILSGKEVEFTVEEIVENFLKPLDQHYYSETHSQSIIDDNQYDTLYNIARAMDPTNVYFTGVGSDVRGDKVKLPYTMGSLDQVYEAELTQWVEQKELEDETIIISEKLDGVSCMLIYNSTGDLQIAYSRGNGVEGADITRHVRKICNLPEKNINMAGCAIRAEIIVSHENFKTLQKLIKTRSNKQYKNARNLIAGLMNAKENNNIVYEYINVICYEIINQPLSKSDQLTKLKLCGFQVPWFVDILGLKLTDHELSSIIQIRKDVGAYEIDGVVLDVDDYEKRLSLNPTRDTFNPAYSVKYKVVDSNNVKRATVQNVEWNISKHGYLKPKVVFDAVDVGGVTIKNATGFNAKFIKDNNIGPGAVVELVRSGDVIPFIRSVLIQSESPKLPNPKLEWEWNETNVDIVLQNPDDNPEVKMQQIIDFFTSLNVAHLKEGNIRKFANYIGSFDIIDFLNSDSKDWQLAIGTNGLKIHQSITERFSNLNIYELMGSTSIFGRGLGKRKFKLLLQSISFEDLKSATVEQIAQVEGFDIKTAEKIITGMSTFCEWLDRLGEFVNITYENNTSEGKFKGHKVCFTGFRDKVLAEKVESLGGVIQSAVSSKTTYLVAANPNSTSSKMKKARTVPGITIFSVEEFKNFLNES